MIHQSVLQYSYCRRSPALSSKLTKFFVALFLIGISTSAFAAKKSDEEQEKWKQALPESAKKILNSLPDHAISLDLVVSRAMESSDSFKALSANLITIETPLLDANSIYDIDLTLKAERTVNTNEPTNAFSTNRLYSTNYTVSTSKVFSTGTILSAEIENSQTLVGFPTFPSFDYVETKGTFFISQSLWNNAFGTGYRNQSEAGKLARDAAIEQHAEAVEQWTTDLIGLFYQAWLAQTRAWASKGNVARRDRLDQVTKIKVRRGTSERPDVLQVNAALLQAEVDFKESLQNLGVLWRQLVTALKMPEEWLRIDPLYIPIQADTPVPMALEVCGDKNQLKAAPEKSTTTEKARLQAEAAELQFNASKSLAKPEVNLELGLVTNGVADSFRPGFSEAASIDHPAWSVGLEFVLPLGDSSGESAVRKALAQRDRAEAIASSEAADLKTRWLNDCNDVHRLQESVALLEKSFKQQDERVRLEENRFRLGRVPSLSVIQAGDDAMIAEINHSVGQINARIAAWKVLRLSGDLKKYIKRLTENRIELNE